MSIIHRLDQGSAEWYAVRLGIPTASNFHRIVTPTGKLSTQSRAYMYKLVAERLLKESMDEQLRVEWVERGKVEQPNAAAQFQLVREVELDYVGFITTDDGRYGCSPDALILTKDNAEGVELKCPAPWTMVGYYLDGLGADYKPQVQGQILVAGFECVHFYAWHPRMPPFHQVTLPDTLFIYKLKEALDRFCDELDEATEVARAKGLYVVSEVLTPLQRQFLGIEPDGLTVLDAG